VAARFDTTPSELTKLNRLTTRLIFPGQVLYVPDKQGSGTSGDERPGTSANDGEGSTASTSIATHHLEGDTELPEEKGGNFYFEGFSPFLYLGITTSCPFVFCMKYLIFRHMLKVVFLLTLYSYLLLPVL
jgi:hypothetical protein